MTKYNTNLASEFYVLSALHRLGTRSASRSTASEWSATRPRSAPSPECHGRN